MATKRYLNVQYKTSAITAVDVTGMTRHGELQEAIRKALSRSLGHTLIELYDMDNNHISKSAQIIALHTVYFTKGGVAEHRMQDVKVLKHLCTLYDKPKLYFVVPPQRFMKFTKQEFQSGSEQGIEKLEQYVVELPVCKIETRKERKQKKTKKSA
ncbi:hypothetical protein BJ741DRAFT_705127 [Chytriomyces cf. hyalinus JEL632]|nr:hypothetical protein BJ741DRAFT_705127 [Chytriomyces cf. hyalinus JEL632]